MKEYGDILHKEEGDGYVSYVLKEELFFSAIGFKVMESQKRPGFLPCVKTMLNGKIKITYPVNSYRRLNRVLPSMTRTVFLKFAADLLAKVDEVQENSFLKYYNLDLSENRIFIDCKSNEVLFVYLPLADTQASLDCMEFEAVLRRDLAAWSENILPDERNSLTMFREQLKNYNISLKQIREGLLTASEKGNSQSIEDVSESPLKKNISTASDFVLRLHPIGQELKEDFVIKKEPFIVGRSMHRADGRVKSRQVGNTHCRILFEGNKYYVIDLSSRNGTYINGIRVPAEQPCVISEGDMLLLADTGFKVQIQGCE